MKNVQTYVPKCARGANAAFDGQVKFTFLSFDERYDLMGDAADAHQSEGISKTKDGLALVRRAAGAAKNKIVEVSLKKKDGTLDFSSPEDLFNGGKDGHDVLVEVGVGLLNGFKDDEPESKDQPVTEGNG